MHFAPRTGQHALVGVRWLNETRLAQRAVFEEKIELVANFSDAPFQYEQTVIPGQSIQAKSREDGRTVVYAPGAVLHHDAGHISQGSRH
jgi:hypothetical protein